MKTLLSAPGEHAPAASSAESVDFNYLLALRNGIGPSYGSEDVCVLLYSMIKRERPALVVELGTGLGVTTAWIAAALAENGHGTIVTVDNGAHFETSGKRQWREQLQGPLAELADRPYGEFLATIFARAGVSRRVKVCRSEIDLHELSWLEECLGSDAPKIDVVFSDYNHSATNTATLVASFLPRMAEVGSIFIDSASTHLPSYYLLEHLVELLNAGRVPKEMLAHAARSGLDARLEAMTRESRFRLMHLVEKRDRSQNSTAWLRVERASLLPALALAVH